MPDVRACRAPLLPSLERQADREAYQVSALEPGLEIRGKGR